MVQDLQNLTDSKLTTQTDISEYPYWRNRVMYSMLTGYAVFYFIRKNMSVANPLIR